MKHYLGLSEYHLRQKQQEYPVNYEPEKLINAHLLVCGMSGTGKSYQSRQLLGSAVGAGIELDVFDVHDELDGIAGATACRYSQATGYGYNPLALSPDPHTGGPARQAEYLLGLVRESAQLGIRQDMVLRNLILDTYQLAGIYPDNPATWQRDNITEAGRRQLREARNWAALKQFTPRWMTSRTMAGASSPHLPLVVTIPVSLPWNSLPATTSASATCKANTPKPVLMVIWISSASRLLPARNTAPAATPPSSKPCRPGGSWMTCSSTTRQIR